MKGSRIRPAAWAGLGVGLLGIGRPCGADEPLRAAGVDGIATAVSMTAAIAMFMLVPGLGLYFAGMARRKNVLATFQQSFALLGAVTAVWVLAGYSLAFGVDWLSGLCGGWDRALMMRVGREPRPGGPAIPEQVWFLIQLIVATFGAAMVSGAVAERMRFVPYLAVAALWVLVVEAPIAHWVWGGGWMSASLGVLDRGGGLVVQVPAGFSALCAAIVVGRRRALAEEEMLPHNLTLMAVGTGLIWFGWLGLSMAMGEGLETSSTALVNTHLMAGAGMVSWSSVEWFHKGKATVMGSCTGALTGLSASAAGSAYLAPQSAAVVGLLVAPVCYAAVVRRGRLRYDDAMDVFAIHGVGGLMGVLATGVLASGELASAAGRSGSGLQAGDATLLGRMALASLIVAVYSVSMTFVILKVVGLVVDLRVSEEDEEAGLDLSQHGGRGYILEAGEAFALRADHTFGIVEGLDEDEAPKPGGEASR